MVERQFWRDQTSQRLAHDVGGTRPNRLEPARHIVSHFGGRVRTIRTIALARVASIEGEGAKPCTKMALGPAERAMVATQPAQEYERVTLLTHFLIVKRMFADDALGHGSNRLFSCIQKVAEKLADHQAK
jgi:hypothetical protein